MTKFVDSNIFIRRWDDKHVEDFIDSIEFGEYCTSVLVLSEVHHKLSKKNIKGAFKYIRNLMGSLVVHDFVKGDIFNAMKNPCNIGINDKIHIEIMKRNNINTIISYDKDFDQVKTIKREEP